MRRKAFIIADVAVIAAAIVTALLFWLGILKFNSPSRKDYPIRGVDVSSYQGVIDWDEIRSQDIDFAFIKATEGSGFVDERFMYNWENAKKSGIRVGAYHFFSFDSAGETQAENFISTVASFENMLPPVVDVELYGAYLSAPPTDTDTIKTELRVLLRALEDEYGKTPILYATGRSYEMFLQDDFEEYDIWIRDVFSFPKLPDGREWTFWQYTNRGRLHGYDGEERYIDLNVFFGDEDEFKNYGK